MGFNACDVVYDTSEEASTWRQAKAAERNTRARARRGAGDQSRRSATVEWKRPTERRAYRDGCRARGTPPPSLSSLKAASGTLIAAVAALSSSGKIESLDRGPGEIQVCQLQSTKGRQGRPKIGTGPRKCNFGARILRLGNSGAIGICPRLSEFPQRCGATCGKCSVWKMMLSVENAIRHLRG
jgi:hypothetical protein